MSSDQSSIPQSLKPGITPTESDSPEGDPVTMETPEEKSNYTLLLEAIQSPLQVIAANSTTISNNTAQTVDHLETLDTGILEITSLIDKLQLELEQHTKALLYLLQKQDAVIEGMQGGGNTIVENSAMSARQLTALDYKVLEIHNILQQWQLEKQVGIAPRWGRRTTSSTLRFCRALPFRVYSYVGVIPASRGFKC